MVPPLIDYMRKLNNILRKNEYNDVMDLKDYDFLAPPVLLPVLQYMELNNINKYIPHPNTKPYLEKVLGRERCSDTTYPLRKLKKFHYDNTYGLADQVEEYLSDITDGIFDLFNLNLDKAGVNLIVYEMLTNIYKHSEFNNAYILCQKYPNVNKLDICMIDDGVTIPGSFEDYNINFINDTEAIFDAINGKNTDKEGYQLHGRGLNTTASITSLAFGEEMLVASRNGVCTVNPKGVKLWYKNMPIIHGTFIALRVNTNKIPDISNYTKKREFEKI